MKYERVSWKLAIKAFIKKIAKFSGYFRRRKIVFIFFSR